MPILEIDLSKPAQGAPQKFGAWWPTKFSDIYKNQPNAALISIAGSPGIDWGKLYFEEGLILQAARFDSDNLGEVLGIFMDVSSLQPFQSIRVEVHFDVLQVRRELHYPTRIIRVPTFRRGIGLGWRELTIPAGLPVVKQFVGGLGAVVTTEDMGTGVITEGSDKAAGTCYVRYAPDHAPPDESVILGPGIFATLRKPKDPGPFDWLPMKFFADLFDYPIAKDLTAPTNIWDGNPVKPYVLELALDASNNMNKGAPLGIGLRRTADNAFLGLPPYLDTSRFEATDFKDDLSTIRYAGANLVIAKFPPEYEQLETRLRNFGPARVRLKKLLIETT